MLLAEATDLQSFRLGGRTGRIFELGARKPHLFLKLLYKKSKQFRDL